MGRPVAAAETDRGSHWGSAMLRRQSTRDCEPQIFVLSPVAHDLIHRTSKLAGVSIKSSLDPYAAVTKIPRLLSFVFLVFLLFQKVQFVYQLVSSDPDW